MTQNVTLYIAFILVEQAILINKTGLIAQEASYLATITITCSEAYNNPQKVSVSLKITKEPPPEIWLSSTELKFSTEVGSNPPSQNFRVRNSGKGNLNYGISSDASWLIINPVSGSSSGQDNTHTVSVKIGNLGEGTYSGTLTVADPNASNSPQRVRVTL